MVMDNLASLDMKAESNLPKGQINTSNGVNEVDKSSINPKSSSDGLKRNSGEGTRVRFFICTLSLLSLTTSQMSRMVLNQSITVMVDPSMINSQNKLVANTTDPPQEPSSTLEPTVETIVTSEYSSTYMTEFSGDQGDMGCERGTTPVFNVQSNISGGTFQEPIHETYQWDTDHRSTLLGGFYYGYFIFMIPGGRIAEVYGSKYILLASVAGSAIVNIATPWMARNNFALLVTSRVILGALQSGLIPGMYALFNEWLTFSETSIFAPLIKMNLRLGMMFGSALCGYMGYSWPLTFYATGLICTVWSVVWLVFATSNPIENRWVSESELAHINKKKPKELQKIVDDSRDIELTNHSGSIGDKEKKKSEATPWIKLITSPSVVGLIMIKLVFNYSVDFLVILLPSYLANVHHAQPQTVSYITMPMFGIQALLVVFVGWFAKYVVKERPYNLSRTTIRKIFQNVCNGGMALALILLTFNNYNLIYVAIMLQVMSLMSMFTAGGDTMLPYDLSDKYPATIMAIANCIGNISGVTTLEISRYVLRGMPDSYDQWNKLLYVVAGGNIVGLLGFNLLVKAEPIDFTKGKSIKEKNQIKVAKVQHADNSVKEEKKR